MKRRVVQAKSVRRKSMDAVPVPKVMMETAIEPIHIPPHIAREFVMLPEADWPAPTIGELLIAFSLQPDGSDAERASRAVARAWECALAGRRARESLRKMRLQDERGARSAADFLQWMGLKAEDFPLPHRDFLARLNTKPLKVRRRMVLRGHALWIHFLQCYYLPRPYESAPQRTVSEEQAREWDAARERDGWSEEKADRLEESPLFVAECFVKWRARIKSEGKRAAAQAGRKALDGARFQRREKKRAG